MISFPGRVKQNGHVRPSESSLTEEIAVDDPLKRQDKVSVWNVTRTIRSKDLAMHKTVSHVNTSQRAQPQKKWFKFFKKVLRFLFCCAIV